MLALVHPFASDVPHRASGPSSSRTRSQSRKSAGSSSGGGSAIPSSSSAASSSTPSTSRAGTSRHPLPALQRQHTAPLPSSSSSQSTSQPPLPHRQSSPPPRVPRAPSPEEQEQEDSETEAEPAQPMQQSAPRVDIHSLPSAELLSLLAQLLSNIASANDELGASGLDASHHAADHHRAPVWNTLTTASRAALSTPSSTLTFHARNIPTISLEAYLVRILKYCPTTNEVFLSLLVYFDRMSKLSLEATGRTFVIDSYNIHRLVIAGVTVASKFFSDVFYTNSRYAKVGGLPLTELNQLELQFLLLNNFSLVIHQDEMQRYAEQLILFSHKHSSSPLPHTIVPLSSIPSSSQTGSAAPTPAMGAVDAYGGQIPTHPSSATPHANHEQAPSSVSAAFRPRYSSGDDTETETETETETDGGSTTDDEPTIRPAHSSAGSVSDDSSSLYSTSTTSEDADEADEIMDGDAIREMDIVEDSDGGRTPDVRKFFGGSTPPRMRPGDDSQMASP